MGDDQVIFVGYVISLPGPTRNSWGEPMVLPRSVSPGFGRTLPESWCLGWTVYPTPPPEEAFAAVAAREGILDAPALAAITNRAHLEGTLVAAQFCQQADTIRELLALLPTEELRVFGVGLRSDDMSALVEVYKDWGDPKTTMEMLRASRPSMPAGVTLGWELLVCDWDPAFYTPTLYSWLNNGVQGDAQARGYPLVEGAFLVEYEHARTLARELTDGSRPAEPGLWLPWLVADYSEQFR